MQKKYLPKNTLLLATHIPYFPYRTIFEYADTGKTVAQLKEEGQEFNISPRRLAVEQMRDILMVQRTKREQTY